MQVSYCSGCGRIYRGSISAATPYVASSAVGRGEQGRPRDESDDFTDATRWHTVGENFLYCPACWNAEADKSLFVNPFVVVHGADDAAPMALWIALVATLAVAAVALVQMLIR